MDIKPTHSEPRTDGDGVLTVKCAQAYQPNMHVHRCQARRVRVWVERRGTKLGAWCDACDGALHLRDHLGLDPDPAAYSAVQAILPGSP